METVNTSLNVKHMLSILGVVVVTNLAAVLLAGWQYSVLFALSAATFLVSYLLMNKLSAVFDFTRLTVPTFFWYTYIVMMFVPSFFVFFANPGDYRGVYLIAVQSVMITVPLGGLFANFAFGMDKERVNRFFDADVYFVSNPGTKNFSILILMVALFFVVLFMSEVKQIALLYIIQNPHIYIMSRLLRLQSHHLLETNLRYFYFWTKAVIFPFINIFSFGSYVVTREKFWLRFFIFSFIGGLFYAMLDLQKLPAAAIFFTIILFYLNYKRWKVSPLLFAAAPFILLALPYLVFWLIRPEGEQTLFYSIVEAIFNRLFYVPADVVYSYFEIFPRQMGFLGGASSKAIAFIFGKEFFDVPKYVFKFWLGSPVLGHANACFIAGLYADWGLPGVISGGLLTGFLIQSGQIWIVRQGKSVLTLCLLTFLMFASWMLNSAEILTTINSHGVLVAIMLFLFLRRWQK